MGSDHEELSPMVQRAYALTTPDEGAELYREWAGTYDADLLNEMAYNLPTETARALASRLSPEANVLDVGCGTGLLAAELSQAGFTHIDGCDLSPEMLAEASHKSLYTRLEIADVTDRLPFDDGTYDGVAAAGLFTVGHVGPDGIPELLRVAKPGAPVIITVRTDFWESRSFPTHIDTLIANGQATELKTINIQPYRNRTDITSKLATVTR